MTMMLSLAAFAVAAPVAAQPAAPAGQVTVESYYRIKWGSAAEFRELYDRNHQPILKELQRQGFITALRIEEPFMHMAGGQRWDLRVTITYRDSQSAVLVDGAFDKASEAAMNRLYPDEAKHTAEEARRFSLLEEHWDVIVIPAGD